MARLDAILREWQIAVGYTYESGGSLPPESSEEVKELLTPDGGLLVAIECLSDIVRLLRNSPNGIIECSRIENTIIQDLRLDADSS